jgi:hypothetical protein
MEVQWHIPIDGAGTPIAGPIRNQYPVLTLKCRYLRAERIHGVAPSAVQEDQRLSDSARRLAPKWLTLSK